MCMLFLGRCMLSCCCCQEFLCPPPTPFPPSWLPLEVGQAGPGAQGPHEAPPGGGSSAITLLAVQLATQLQYRDATSQTIALRLNVLHSI